ncbi:MAG: type I-E CRISPR-associated endoribonuclease Cas2e [Solobacterium sp.]|jgi:CRISPR-associated protein Cas2|nr:type I-E CRISPR-associated endoribonuclease Cas2e [Solobacterium sp.]MCH4222141.1 type I-E CRISPR-associated endoribonuclease Cas2e [Solobacterium sp.]
MTIIVMDNVSTSTRGECTKYLLEVKTGVFVGNITSVVRELVWQKIQRNCANGGAILIYSMANEQGYELEMFGDPRKKVIDLDGIKLIQTA